MWVGVGVGVGGSSSVGVGVGASKCIIVSHSPLLVIWMIPVSLMHTTASAVSSTISERSMPPLAIALDSSCSLLRSSWMSSILSASL